MAEIRDTANSPPTIYDVARVAGVSIASVSRVLNGQRNPREETRERVLHAVAELGFAPDGAARALSARLKEVVGVVVRRVPWVETSEGVSTQGTRRTTTPTTSLSRALRALAAPSGAKPSSATACRTRSLVSSRGLRCPFSTRETEAIETPATRAT